MIGKHRLPENTSRKPDGHHSGGDQAIADLRTDVSMRVEASDTECVYVWTIISSPLAACGGDERPIVSREPNVSTVASLIADPARAAMLSALLDGRALPAGELAHASGVTAQTASSHLSKLLAGGLLALETAGRHRYYRLAGSQVAGDRMPRCDPGGSARQKKGSERGGAEAQKLRYARVCYDHLAGRLGVAVTQGLIE